MITQEQLTLVYNWAFSTAERLVREGKQVQPVVLSCRFINDKLRTARIYGFKDFGTVEDKNNVAAFIKRLIERPQVDVACFVAESWYVGALVNGTEAETDSARQLILQGMAPSEHPDRKEAVLFQFYTKLYDMTAVCPIERPANTMRQEPVDFTLGRVQGRFAREPIK